MSEFLVRGIFAYRPSYLLSKKCVDQATKFNSHLWTQTVQMGKIPEKDKSFQTEGQFFILPFKKYLYLFFQRSYEFEPDWYPWFYTTCLSVCSWAEFLLMPAGLFPGHGQKWHKGTTPRRQYGQHSPSLKVEGKEHFPCHFFFSGFAPFPFIAGMGVVCTQKSLSAHASALQCSTKTSWSRSNFLLAWTREETICYSCHQPFLEQKCSGIMADASSWVK